MLNKSQSCIGIYLSDDVLKVAQVVSSGANAKLLKVLGKEIKGLSGLELSKTIQTSISGFNVKSSKIFLVLPSSITTTKNIEIPSVNPEEIKSIVSIQAGRHTPLSREEIQIGFVNLGIYKNNFSKVLLVIANKNILKNQLGVLDKIGLKIQKVLFAPEGIAGFYSEILGLKSETTPTGIIDIGQQSTDFIVVFKGMPFASRHIPIGKSQLASEGSAAQDKLIEELGKTIESYKTEGIEQIPVNYLISSEDDQSQKMQPLLKEKLNWNVEMVAFVNNIKAQKDVLKNLAEKSSDSSFLDVVTSTAMVAEAQVNLMLEEVQLQKSIEAQGRELFKAAVLGFVVLILVMCGYGSKYYFNNAFFKKLKNEYKENRKEVEELENLSIKTKIIQNYLANRMISLDTINELYRNIPNEIYLTSVVMDETGTVSVQGISDIASLVFNLGTTLKESNLFKSVNIKSTVAKKDRGKDVHAFEITLKLKTSSDEEGKKTENKEEKKP